MPNLQHFYSYMPKKSLYLERHRQLRAFGCIAKTCFRQAGFGDSINRVVPFLPNEHQLIKKNINKFHILQTRTNQQQKTRKTYSVSRATHTTNEKKQHVIFLSTCNTHVPLR